MLSALTYDAPTGGWVGSFTQAEPTNVPAWSTAMAERFPACEEYVEGDIAASVVVVHPDATVERMSTDAAYAVNSDAERANNTWVVGACR